MARLISFLQELFIRKLGPPVIGAFVAAWVVLHWDHLILLFWGNGLLEERVSTFKSAVDQDWYKKYGIPAVVAFFYLLVLPYISWGVSKLQAHAKRMIHGHRVKTEKILLQHEKELNIERVLADPNKPFIEERARQITAQEKLELEKQHAETDKLRAEAEKNQADADIAKTEAVKQQAEQADNEVKIKRAEAEKLRLESAAQIQKATIASNRFPAAYMLTALLDEELQAHGVSLSFDQATSIIAILFGYKSFRELVNDPQFTNETVQKLFGVYYDADALSKQIYQELAADEELLEHFDPGLLYDCFYEHPHLRLLDQNSLDGMAQSLVEDSQYELFSHDKVTAAMAETNTIYDEVVEIVFEDSEFDGQGYIATFTVILEGHERREASVRGLMPISITAMVYAPLILGLKGLGQLKLEVKGAEVVWPR